MTTNMNPLEKRGPVPTKAKLLRKLLEFKATGHTIDLWMTFPQNSCCFAFGPHKGPVPIGALFLLWSAGWPYLQECPECHGEAYMVDFGGLLAVGGGTLICPTCENSWIQWLGGLDRVANEYLYKSPLIGTEFQPSGALFGGAYTSDGRRLRHFLKVNGRIKLGPGPSLEVGGHELFMELAPDLSSSEGFQLRRHQPLWMKWLQKIRTQRTNDKSSEKGEIRGKRISF